VKEDFLLSFLWPQACFRKCSLITGVRESEMLELYKIYSEVERNRSCHWKLFLEDQA